MAKIGYARVSTGDQNIEYQTKALTAAGCATIFSDEGLSGLNRDRSGLAEALAALQEGDQLVIWRLDRLARSLPHLLELAEDLNRRKIGLQSLTEQIDTSTPSGRLVYSIFGAIAQFERDLTLERSAAGRASSRARGVHQGRPKSMSSLQVREARKMIADGVLKKEVALIFKVSARTLRRELA